MKKIISETIDGSMKDIIQLKTLDSSLEYSQLFDALDDCPQDFKAKLIGALNSLGQTMGIPPTDVFNQVLCASEDENAKKKLYNWWRAVFEVVSKSVPNIPEDRRQEYEDKLDALISEICRAGDKASGNDVVLEDYEPADIEEEDKLKEDMTFAISKIGEVAKKAEELVNFLNPYCGTEVNESGKPGRYGIGDHVLYKGEECVVTDVDEDLRNDEEIYQVSRDSDKVDGLSFNYWATWDEIEPVHTVGESAMDETEVRDFVKAIGFRPDSDGIDYETQLVDALTGKDTSYNAGWGAVYYNSDKVLQFLKKYGMLGSRGIKQKEAISKLKRLFKSGKWKSPQQDELFNEVNNTMNENEADDLGAKDISKLIWDSQDDEMEVLESYPPKKDGSVKFDVFIKNNGQLGEHVSIDDIVGLAEDVFGDILRDTGWEFEVVPTNEDNIIEMWNGADFDGKVDVYNDQTRLGDSDGATFQITCIKANGQFNKVDSTMKKIDERRGSDWVSMDDMIGMEVGESDDGEGFWKAMDDVDNLERKGYWSAKFKVGDKVTWIDPDGDEIKEGWTVVSAPESEDEDDDMYTIETDDGSEAEVYGSELRPALETVMEGDIENELAKGDDGWRELGQSVGEAKATVWCVVLSDGTEKKFKCSKDEAKTKAKELADKEGLEVKKVYPVLYPRNPYKGIFKETTVTVDANDVWDVLDFLDDEVANKNLTDLINSHVRTEDEIMDAIDSVLETSRVPITKSDLNTRLAKEFENVVFDLDLDVEKFKETGEFVDPEKPVALEGSDEEQKPDEVKDGEKKYKQDGETKTLVTGSEKKVVTEMTIEQEVDDPWKLVNLLWGQGKDNFQELLDSNLFGDDTIMSTLEQFEIRNLGTLNDFLAFEFENFLEALGCDREAWVQNLEITRGGSEEVDEASKKKVASKDPMIAKIEEMIPVDAKDGLIEIRPDRFDSYLAVYAPGSEPEMVAATQALSKAFPDYYVGYDNNSVAIWPKKRV